MTKILLNSLDSNKTIIDSLVALVFLGFHIAKDFVEAIVLVNARDEAGFGCGCC